MVLDTYLDRSLNQRLAQSNASNFVKSFIKNTNLVDVWRILNATGREYSFHSRAHNVYSRIEVKENFRSWRLDPQLLTRKQFCDYLKTQIRLFFEINDKDDISPVLLWESFKA